MKITKRILPRVRGLLRRFSKRGRQPVIRVTRRYPSLRARTAPVPVANPVKKYRNLIGMLVIGLLLVACSPATAEPEVTVEPGLPNTGTELADAAGLIAALEAQGAAVEQAGTVDEPLFDVNAALIRVNGQDVQVFEFPDEATREAATDTIGPNASMIGSIVPEWVDTPRFWAEQQLIVLYVGQDQTVIDALTAIMGEPVAIGTGIAGPAVQPEAVLAAVSSAAQSLGVDLTQVQVVRFEETEWPNACLGLAQPDEVCAEVVTPGFLVVVEANGQQYEVHTDQTGTNVRIQQP